MGPGLGAKVPGVGSKVGSGLGPGVGLSVVHIVGSRLGPGFGRGFGSQSGSWCPKGDNFSSNSIESGMMIFIISRVPPIVGTAQI